MSTASWIQDLPDQAIAADLEQYASNGVLTYSAALQILDDVAAQGVVTSAELTSLQTIAQYLNNGLAASSYVASIFDQLVLGSPANAAWNGGEATATPLGDLAVGTSAAQLNELIGTWFLGTNLPDPTLPAGATGWELTGYSAISAPLYGPSGAPAVGDICQGGDGDCELLTGLIEEIENHPQLADSMIVQNANGTFGVRFFVNGNEDWVTVNNELPSGPQGPVYAQVTNAQDSVLWVALVEKAYAQLSATGLIDHPAVNSYDNINGNTAFDVLGDLGNSSIVNYYDSGTSYFFNDKPFYEEAIANGDNVILETGDNAPYTYDASGNIELVPDHAFAVIGYDASTGDFIVRNPWGDAFAGQNWDVQFEVSLSDITNEQGDLVIDNSGTNGSSVVVTPYTGEVPLGGSIPVSELFTALNLTGKPITEYCFQLLGPGSLLLNGAVDLATPAQAANGDVIVSAADLSKVAIAMNEAGGTLSDLIVSATDGVTWSAAEDVGLMQSSMTAAVNQALFTPLQPGATVAISSLFSETGALTAAWYAFYIPSGGGTLNLNGAANLSSEAGEYVIPAAELSLVTYTAPQTSGVVQLQVDLTAGGGSSDAGWQYLDISVGGSSVAQALQAYASGQLSDAADIADTAANIFANLDALQAMFSAGVLQDVLIDDPTPQVVNISQAQYARDLGVISVLRGDFSLTVLTTPTVAALQFSPATTLSAGGTDTITLSFSEAVTVAGTPTLSLNDGGTAAFVGGSGTNALTFSYTVGAGDANTASLAVTAVNLAGGSIADAVGDAANLAVSGVTQSGPEINVGAPRVAAIFEAASGGQLAAGSQVTIALDFNEAVSVSGSPTLTLANGGVATLAGGSGGHALVFDYTVGSGGASLASLAPTTLALAGGSIQDSLGDAASLSLSGLSVQTPSSLVTASGAQTLSGGEAAFVQAGETLTGGSGVNTAVFTGSVEQYGVSEAGAVVTVTDDVASRDGTVTLNGVQQAEFSDITLVFDLHSSEDVLVYELYQAAYDRIPDNPGFRYWANVADAQHLSALQLADAFLAAPEFTERYGADPSNLQFVTELYTNVLGRQPDQAGLNYWVGQANAGQPRDQLLVDFATSPENVTLIGAHTADGFWTTH
jgi:hypothetical protein